MGRQKSAALVSALKMVANDMDWQQAYLANPGCGTWANFNRAAKAQQSDADAAAAAAEPDPPPPPETAARPALKRTRADTAASHRTGPKVTVETRQTTHQTQVAKSNRPHSCETAARQRRHCATSESPRKDSYTCVHLLDVIFSSSEPTVA